MKRSNKKRTHFIVMISIIAMLSVACSSKNKGTDPVTPTETAANDNIDNQGTGTDSTGTTDNSTANTITESRAKEIAYEHAKVNASDVENITIRKDTDSKGPVYEVEFYIGDQEYDYEIHRETGEILEFKVETADADDIKDRATNVMPAASTEPITESASPSSASTEPITESASPSSASTEPVTESASPSSASTEPTTETTTKEIISEEEAKIIAFTHANVKEADIRNLVVKFEQEKTGVEYEIEFHYSDKEYEYTIDAKTGNILESDIEPIHK